MQINTRKKTLNYFFLKQANANRKKPLKKCKINNKKPILKQNLIHDEL
jgi:hypothetical protein